MARAPGEYPTTGLCSAAGGDGACTHPRRSGTRRACGPRPARHTPRAPRPRPGALAQREAAAWQDATRSIPVRELYASDLPRQVDPSLTRESFGTGPAGEDHTTGVTTKVAPNQEGSCRGCTTLARCPGGGVAREHRHARTSCRCGLPGAWGATHCLAPVRLPLRCPRAAAKVETGGPPTFLMVTPQSSVSSFFG